MTAPANPPSWAERARYMTVIGRLQRELSRELDRVQVGADTTPALAEALGAVVTARDGYHRDVRMAVIDARAEAEIAARGGTMEP